jgi:itaconate CoA-transferase
VTGTPEAPAKVGASMADIAAGMYAYSGILAALLQRQRDGRGRRVEVSMLESLGEWMGFPMYYAFDAAEPPPRSGASHATIYPYGPFAAGDGKTVMLGLQNEREWVVFCDRVLQQPALATDPRFHDNAARNARREELHALIVQAFAALTADQVVQRLDAAQIANAKVNTMQQFWQHPQLAARERWREVGTPVGPIPALLPPGQWDDGHGPRMDPVPALGEHTDALLAELGYGAGEIAALRAAQAI